MKKVVIIIGTHHELLPPPPLFFLGGGGGYLFLMWSMVLDKLTLISILIWYVAGPNFRYKCDGRGVCASEVGGALGGDLSSQVLRHGGRHLVVTKVVPITGGGSNH